jgi:serine/threonine protein kinase
VVGSILGHYKILDKLGAGGMDEVYQAEDTTLERQVALKVLPEAFTADADYELRVVLDWFEELNRLVPVDSG